MGPYARRPSHELRPARWRLHPGGDPGGARRARDRADRDSAQSGRGARPHCGAARSHSSALGGRGQARRARAAQGMAGARREGRRRRHGRTRVPLAAGDGRDARGPHATRRGERVPEGRRFDAGEATRSRRADGNAGSTTDRIRSADGAAPMNPRASGFTLIELLVALVIFGIFAVFAYAGLGRLLDNRERLTEEQRVWQELSLTFLRISDDVAHARSRAVRDVSGFELRAFVGRPFDPRALAEPSLELTRGGELNYGGGPHSDLRRVAYRLKEGRLLRITWPVLDRAPTTVSLEAPLLGAVEIFQLRFYGASGESVDTWPTSASGIDVPPRAMEVTLAVKGVGRFKRLSLVNQ